jgi:hypothetical protein
MTTHILTLRHNSWFIILISSHIVCLLNRRLIGILRKKYSYVYATGFLLSLAYRAHNQQMPNSTCKFPLRIIHLSCFYDCIYNE